MEQWKNAITKLEAKFDKRFEHLSSQLEDIRLGLQRIAIQDERINMLEDGLNNLRGDIHTLVKPNGVISKIRQFQASCPRDKVNSIQKYVVSLTLAICGGLLGFVCNILLTYIKGVH